MMMHGVAVRSLTGAKKTNHRRQLIDEILSLLAKDPAHSVKRLKLVSEATLDCSSYVTVGAYNHGGQYRVTKYTSEAPELTKKITELLYLDFPHECAGVWEEMKPGDVFRGGYMEMQAKGAPTPGQVHSLKTPVTVNPKRWHCAVQGTEGPRLLLVGHTIGSWRKLKPEMVKELEDLGLSVPMDGDVETSIRAINEVTQQVEHYMYEAEEDDEIKDFHLIDKIAEVEGDVVKAAKAAAENLYTPNVEGNLEKWVPSMMDEINAMEFMKAIKRARGQEAKDFLNLAGAVVVPGKGVYTAKPPSKPNTWFRRKTRIVSCGNFQKKSQDEVNYSGGAAAEGVRLMIAEGARRRWCIINGDQCLLEIPSLCEPDELWIALAAMMKKAVTNLGLKRGTRKNFVVNTTYPTSAAKEWMSLDPSTFPESFEEKDLKGAQSITGELAWLAQRCRPDLSYTV
eukprot:s3129_g4.t1